MGVLTSVVLAVLYLASTSWLQTFPRDVAGYVVGRDFLNFWTMGRQALTDNPAQFYDWRLYNPYLQNFLGPDYPLQQWKDEAAKELQEIANKSIPNEMQGGVVVENGTVYREIVEAAKDLDIEHIVMGAHRPSLADFLLGPNSARVARHAGCSVTVVRD